MTFTTEEGERVYFDSNGDSPARYELVNLQMTNKGTMEGATVGIYDASLPESHQFIMKNTPVVWGDGLTEVKQRQRFGHRCWIGMDELYIFYVYNKLYMLNGFHTNCVHELCCRRCLCRCAVAAVSQELVRSSRKESQSAAMVAYPVQQARSVI